MITKFPGIPLDRVLEWILSFKAHPVFLSKIRGPHQSTPETGFHSIPVRGLSNFVYSGNNFKPAGDKMVDQVVADSSDTLPLAFQDVWRFMIHFRASTLLSPSYLGVSSKIWIQPYVKR